MDCFPSESYAITALLRIFDIVETKEVDSAAIECLMQPKLLINKDFVTKHAETPEKLFMLIMHELHHILLGPTKQFPTESPLQNFVFDCIVNALLSRMFPSIVYTELFTQLYSSAEFPECFLRPPESWNGIEVKRIPEGATVTKCKQSKKFKLSKKNRFGNLYKALYSGTGVTLHDIYRLMSEQVDPCMVKGIPLLGGHRKDRTTLPDSGESKKEIDSTKSNLQKDSPMLYDMVREIVEKWPNHPHPVRRRPLKLILQKTNSRIHPHIQHIQLQKDRYRQLRRLRTNKRVGIRREFTDSQTVDSSTAPGFDRHDLILRSLGQHRSLFTPTNKV